MEEMEIVEIARQGIYVLIQIFMPVMLAALIVGLVISLLQALTQIQEQTLSFAPKILAVFFVVMMFMPYMIENLQAYADVLFAKIASSGAT